MTDGILLIFRYALLCTHGMAQVHGWCSHEEQGLLDIRRAKLLMYFVEHTRMTAEKACSPDPAREANQDFEGTDPWRCFHRWAKA